jgi:hypothetical protein
VQAGTRSAGLPASIAANQRWADFASIQIDSIPLRMQEVFGMPLQRLKAFSVGAVLLAVCGCQPTPVVVEPDGDADTTVIKDRDIEADREPAMPAPDNNGTDVNVDVGGGKGVDVDVNRDSDNR